MKSESILRAEREADRSLQDFELALEGLNTQITHVSTKVFEARDRALEIKDRALVIKDKIRRPRELLQEAVGVHGEEGQQRFNATIDNLATKVQDQVRTRVTTTVQGSLTEAQGMVDEFIFQTRAQAEEALASLDRRPLVNLVWLMMTGVAVGAFLSRRFAGTRSIGGAVAAAPTESTLRGSRVLGANGIITSDMREGHSEVA